MGILDLFRRKSPVIEQRSSASGFTAEIMAARESYLSGRRGVGELTATAQACVSLWEGGLSMADVDGTDLLTRSALALTGRSLALRGEALFLIRGTGLVPCADWDLSTRGGVPRAYRVSVSEAGGGTSETALAGEVLHIRIGADPAAPWLGTAPLRRAALTAGLMHAVETALREVYETAPLGSIIAHLPEGVSGNAADMRESFRGRRGSVMIVEGVAQAVAGGMHPNAGRAPDQLSPNLEKAMTRESLDAARGSIAAAFGVLPALLSSNATGPIVREAQRHLAQWQLMPIAGLLAEEATQKLGSPVTLDVMRPLQAFDTGGRARAMTAVVKALAEAKAAGIDPSTALRLVDWNDR